MLFRKKIPPAFFSVLSLMTLFSGCGDTRTIHSVPCTTEWFSEIEQFININDNQTDILSPGSLKWRSAVEIQLNLSSDPQLPNIDSAKWCAYIHEVLNAKNYAS